MEQRASQLIGLLPHCDVSAGQLTPRSGRRNWRSLLPLFEIASMLVRFDHVAREINYDANPRGRFVGSFRTSFFALFSVSIANFKYAIKSSASP